MHNILLQLYHGELAPSSSFNAQIPKHRAKRQACLKHYNDFLQKLNDLDPELANEMDELLDEQLFTDFLDLPEAFIEGFRMGAQIMLAVCTPDHKTA